MLSEQEMSASKRLFGLQVFYDCLKYLKKANVLFRDIDVTFTFNDFKESKRDEVQETHQFPSLTDERNPSMSHKTSDNTTKIHFYKLQRLSGGLVQDLTLCDALEALCFPEIYHTGTNHFGTNRNRQLGIFEYGQLRMQHYCRRWANIQRLVFFWKTVSQKNQLDNAVNTIKREQSLSKRKMFAYNPHFQVSPDERKANEDSVEHKISFNYNVKDTLTRQEVLQQVARRV